MYAWRLHTLLTELWMKKYNYLYFLKAEWVNFILVAMHMHIEVISLFLKVTWNSKVCCILKTFIGIIGVNLQSKNPSFFATTVPFNWYKLLLVCLQFPYKDMTDDWDNIQFILWPSLLPISNDCSHRAHIIVLEFPNCPYLRISILK